MHVIADSAAASNEIVPIAANRCIKILRRYLARPMIEVLMKVPGGLDLTLPIKVINPSIAVAPQLSAADMPEVARAGYKSVIINRPDFEGGADQPASDEVMRVAREQGLEVVYQPVISGALTHDDAVRFAQLVGQLPKPILAYCRSG